MIVIKILIWIFYQKEIEDIRLKLIMKQTEVDTPEVEIRYEKMSKDIEQIVWHVKRVGFTLTGSENGREYQLFPYQILYIEAVDRKTFIYTDKNIYRSKKKLQQLLNDLSSDGFVQVSRTCIANLSKVKSMKSLANSRLEALLINDEKIQVSRTFIPEIKAALSKRGDIK